MLEGQYLTDVIVSVGVQQTVLGNMSRQGQSKGETRQNGDSDRNRQDGNSGQDYDIKQIGQDGETEQDDYWTGQTGW